MYDRSLNVCHSGIERTQVNKDEFLMNKLVQTESLDPCTIPPLIVHLCTGFVLHITHHSLEPQSTFCVHRLTIIFAVVLNFSCATVIRFYFFINLLSLFGLKCDKFLNGISMG